MTLWVACWVHVGEMFLSMQFYTFSSTKNQNKLIAIKCQKNGYHYGTDGYNLNRLILISPFVDIYRNIPYPSNYLTQYNKYQFTIFNCQIIVRNHTPSIVTQTNTILRDNKHGFIATTLVEIKRESVKRGLSDNFQESWPKKQYTVFNGYL